MIAQSIFDVMRPMPPFRPELREANREGVKSQTRRVMDPQPISTTGFWKGLHWANEDHFRKGAIELCKYGQAGDYCYMREPLIRIGAYAFYKDDQKPVVSLITGEVVTWRWKNDVLTSIFMPKEAARSIYRYESIRVERVQEITEEDALDEGVTSPGAKLHFRILWENINASRGFGWDVNPWVWVLGYKPVEANDETR